MKPSEVQRLLEGGKPKSEMNKDTIVFLASFLAVFLLISLVLMVAWNYSLARIFNLPKISYVEAILLYTLRNIILNKIA